LFKLDRKNNKMIKFNNKRDVDKHVSQMSQKLNENEVRIAI